MVFLELLGQCGILELLGQCGILELLGQCGILELLGQCGIFRIVGQCGIFSFFLFYLMALTEKKITWCPYYIPNFLIQYHE